MEKSSRPTRFNFNISFEDRYHISQVLQRFDNRKRKSKKEVFYDFCFCICAPQTTFKNNCKVQLDLQAKDFFKKDIALSELHSVLKPTRFFRQKAKYLLDLKKRFDTIYPVVVSYIEEHDNSSGSLLRDYLESTVLGLGMKAASHLVRNLGFNDVAIIDTHVFKFMGVSSDSVTTKKKYKELEEEFCEISKTAFCSPVELDAWVWKMYSKTEWKEFLY